MEIANADEIPERFKRIGKAIRRTGEKMKIKIKTDQFEGIELNEVKDYEDLTPLQQFCVDEGYDCFEEVGPNTPRWLRHKEYGQCMIRFTGENDWPYVGFGKQGGWSENMCNLEHFNYPEAWKKATTEEIKEALTKEAKQRGYEPGKNIISWVEYDNSIVDIGTTAGFEYQPAIDCLALGNTWIYKKGQWAELASEDIEINGQTIEVEGGAVKISCGDTIDEEKFKRFYELVNKYDLEVSRKGERINEQLQQIWDKMPINLAGEPVKITGFSNWSVYTGNFEPNQ